MAIAPKCNVKGCRKELTQFGALWFGPRSADNMGDKFHICVEMGCFKRVRDAVIACTPEGTKVPRSAGFLLSAPDGKIVQYWDIAPTAYEKLKQKLIEED